MQRTVVLSEASANSDDVNLAHLFSSVNRKIMSPVDKKGNAQNFHVQIRTLCDHASNELRTTIKSANTGYVTKQAVKAWYRVWRQKLRDAGASMKDLGPYGSVFKPRLQNLAYSSGGEHWGGTSVRGESGIIRMLFLTIRLRFQAAVVGLRPMIWFLRRSST